MRNRRGPLAALFTPLVIGLIGLSQLMARPRFQAIHTVDVLQLLASGMCFGVALSAFFVLIRARPDRPA